MLSNETKEQAIIRLHRCGQSVCAIRKATNISYDKVTSTIAYYEKTHQIPETPAKGRKSKLTNNVLTTLAALTLQNRKISCKKLVTEFANVGESLSSTSIWRGMQKLQFQYKQPKIRQQLTDDHKRNRYTFAVSMLHNEVDLEKIIFSDESRFSMSSDNRCIWRRRGEKDDSCYKEFAKYSVSVMVYGAIGINYKSKLVLCTDGVDAMEYRDNIEKSQMQQDLDARYGCGKYIFMQDGAPAHKSNNTSLYLQKRFSFIGCWPANSPDLNPIEHLWGAMKKIIQSTEITSKDHLKQIIFDTWNNFPQEAINRLVRSFHARLLHVINNNGESISDILRSSISTTPDVVIPNTPNMPDINTLIIPYCPDVEDNPIEVKALRPWTPDETMTLLRKVSELGKKWSIIASHLTDRTANACSKRYAHITK